MKFGSYAIFDEVVHSFEKEPNWFWKIKPPTSGDELSIAKFMTINRVELGPDGVRRELPPTYAEICHREIALLFAGTNIPLDAEKSVEDGGEPVVKIGVTVEKIEAVLKQMPHPMVTEIWDAIADAVPTWGPQRPNAKSSSPK